MENKNVDLLAENKEVQGQQSDPIKHKLDRKLRFYGVIFGMMCVFIFGYYIGINEPYNSNMFSDKQVYLHGEIQTFRDSNGKKQGLIEKNGVLYVPIKDKGSFLNYRVEKDEQGNILLSDVTDLNSVNIDTTTLNGNRFTNEDIYKNTKTVFINWASWCSDCKSLFESMNENKAEIDKLKQNGVEFVGVPIDVDNIADINKIINENSVDFENILVDNDTRVVFQSNLTNIPSFVVVDNKGRIVGRQLELVTDSKKLLDWVNEIELCGDC